MTNGGHIIMPPSSGGPEQLIDYPRLFAELGLPAEAVVDDFVFGLWQHSVVNEFSDGEVRIPSDAARDRQILGRLGLENFDSQALGHGLRDLFEGEDPDLRAQVDAVIRVAAAVLASEVSNGQAQLDIRKTVAINRPGRRILADGHIVPLGTAADVVVDYGAGVHGRFFIDNQVADLHNQRRPYVYVPVGKGPFVNEFLQQYLAAALGSQETMRAWRGRVYFGREDGIASASNKLVQAGRTLSDTTEMADVVVASGIHQVGADELQTGIANAHLLLRAGGVLLLRAPMVATTPEVAAGDMVDMALESGFSEQRKRQWSADFRDRLGATVSSVTTALYK